MMDIFFFVAAIVVTVLVVFTALILWRLERVLKNIEHISEQGEERMNNKKKVLKFVQANEKIQHNNE